MELKLEHIVGYLPFELKVNLTRKLFERNDVDLIGSTFAYNSITKEYYIMRNSVTYGLEHIKPLLLPLSSLTKEIEHNGEKFVPMYKLWELCGFEIGRGQYIKIHPNCLITSNFGTAQEFRINISDITSSNYNVILKLYEWHFDIHNLIPNNLAIDKSAI